MDQLFDKVFSSIILWYWLRISNILKLDFQLLTLTSYWGTFSTSLEISFKVSHKIKIFSFSSSYWEMLVLVSLNSLRISSESCHMMRSEFLVELLKFFYSGHLLTSSPNALIMEIVKRLALLLQHLPRGMSGLWSENPVLNGRSLLFDYGNFLASLNLLVLSSYSLKATKICLLVGTFCYLHRKRHNSLQRATT